MITIDTLGGSNISNKISFYALSTDINEFPEKDCPIEQVTIPEGSSIFCYDTGDVYFFNPHVDIDAGEERWQLLALSAGESGGGSSGGGSSYVLPIASATKLGGIKVVESNDEGAYGFYSKMFNILSADNIGDYDGYAEDGEGNLYTSSQYGALVPSASMLNVMSGTTDAVWRLVEVIEDLGGRVEDLESSAGEGGSSDDEQSSLFPYVSNSVTFLNSPSSNRINFIDARYTYYAPDENWYWAYRDDFKSAFEDGEEDKIHKIDGDIYEYDFSELTTSARDIVLINMPSKTLPQSMYEDILESEISELNSQIPNDDDTYDFDEDDVALKNINVEFNYDSGTIVSQRSLLLESININYILNTSRGGIGKPSVIITMDCNDTSVEHLVDKGVSLSFTCSGYLRGIAS